MPERRRHHGLHPQDTVLFGSAALPQLRAATADLSLLLGRGYPIGASTKLVGDRYALRKRQRMAVARAACPAALCDARRAKQVTPSQLRGQPLVLDGFNVLTTLEVALGGGLVIGAVDGTLRDIAGVHGSYRRVQETPAALVLIGELCRQLGVEGCTWLLDRPVSNSGRLRALILELAQVHGFAWQVEVVPNPDRDLSTTEAVVATADGQVLDRCARWFNLVRTVVAASVPGAYLVELVGS